jgi:NAD-dependent deacetylase
MSVSAVRSHRRIPRDPRRLARARRREYVHLAGEAAVLLQARLVAQRIRDAERVVALTGAGISTAAGIPDFRGPRGIYLTRAYPEDVFDIDVFAADPSTFYAFARELLTLGEGIAPTFTHRLLARLEAAGRLSAVITQNIDGLHQRAGSRAVIEIHGGFTNSVCLSCERCCPTTEFLRAVRGGQIPCCEACGGLVKPDVVFFGEAVKGMQQAAQLVRESDLLLVIGSSLTVYPAASLPSQAAGAVLVVARGSLVVPPGAFRIDADIDEFFQLVESELGGTGLSGLSAGR